MTRITLAEVARQCGVTVRAAQIAAARGNIPAFKVGTRWYMDADRLSEISFRGKTGEPQLKRKAGGIVADNAPEDGGER